jgi:branched-chain amino acid transport system ATP-binding protein
MTALLQATGMRRRFGGLIAVDGVDLVVQSREVLGLIGPNGSGKSTLINLLTGDDRRGEGTVTLDAARIDRLAPWRIARLGMARTYQMIRLFPSLDVRQNVALGLHPTMRSGWIASALRLPPARADERAALARADSVLDAMGLAALARRPAGALSIGQQRMVEIARGLAASPRLMLLDEPAAGLSPPNVDRLISIIQDLRDRHGIAVMLVEHAMRVVQSVCDRAIVLDQGRVIAVGTPAAVIAEPAVIEAYIGTGHA